MSTTAAYEAGYRAGVRRSREVVRALREIAMQPQAAEDDAIDCLNMLEAALTEALKKLEQPRA